MALLILMDEISIELDSSNNSIGIFIDLSKAFVYHRSHIIMKKLELNDIRGISLD